MAIKESTYGVRPDDQAMEVRSMRERPAAKPCAVETSFSWILECPNCGGEVRAIMTSGTKSGVPCSGCERTYTIEIDEAAQREASAP